MAFNEPGTLLASGSDDTCVGVWDVEGPAPRRAPRALVPTGHAANIFCVKWLLGPGAHLNTWVYAGPIAPCVVQAAGLYARVPSRVLPGTAPPTRGECNPAGLHTARAAASATAAGPAMVASCSGDCTVRATDVAAGATRILFRHRGSAKKLALDYGCPHVLLSCSEDGTGAPPASSRLLPVA